MKRHKTRSTVVSVLAMVVTAALGCGDSGGSKVDAAISDTGMAQGGQTGSTSTPGDAGTDGTAGAAGSTSTSTTGTGGAAGSTTTSVVAGSTAGGSIKGGTTSAGGTIQTGGAAGTQGKGGASGGSQASDAGVSDAARDVSTEAQRDAASTDLLSVPDTRPGCDALACGLNCPYGYVMDASGCPTCSCAPNPELACSQLAAAGICDASPKCRWLAPGCAFTGTALAAAGCYDKSAIDCTTATGCSDGKSCVPRVINPCADGACGSCGTSINICL